MNDINQISIAKIKKWFEKIGHGKPCYEKEGIKPTRDWGALIIITVIIFCLEIILGLFIYFQVENNLWFQEPSNNAITYVSLNQNLLQKITGQIDAKAAIYSGASTTPTVADPSL